MSDDQVPGQPPGTTAEEVAAVAPEYLDRQALAELATQLPGHLVALEGSGDYAGTVVAAEVNGNGELVVDVDTRDEVLYPEWLETPP